MARLLLLVALAYLLWRVLVWFRRTPPEQVARTLRLVGLWGVIGIMVAAALTGHLNPLIAAGAAAIPLVLRLLSLVQLIPQLRRLLAALGVMRKEDARTAQAPGGDGRSRVRTPFLEMTLDHATGRMDGRVLAGTHAGRLLSALSLPELLDLLRQAERDDPQSARLLTAYLDRSQGPAWRAGAGGGGEVADRGRGMTREEALAILGLAAGASAEAVRDAHRRLMQKLHPDRGGSDYLAAKINEAKRVLIRD